MKTKRLIMVTVGLVVAVAMTFTPISGSYAVMANTQSVDEVSEEVPVSDEPEVETEAVQQTVPEQNDVAEPSDEVSEEEPVTEETENEEATKTRYVWNDGQVKVTAELSDAAAIPDDAELTVKAVDSKSSGYDYDAYMSALNKNSDSRYDEKNTLLYDVAFIKDGMEIQPESGNVSVTFEFLNNQLAESIGAKKASNVNVIHLPLKDKIKDKYDTTADAKNIDAKDITVDKLTAAENGLKVSVKNEKVKFETSDFSVFAYTVDFEYTDPATGKVYTYNLEGAGSITLKELAIILGITTKADADEFISNVEDVKFSNENLVKVQKTLFKGWVLKSLEPFSSEELLTIIMKDGTVIEVKVTDIQESSDLTNFLVNAVITGATQNENGEYEVETGRDYSYILNVPQRLDFDFLLKQNLISCSSVLVRRSTMLQFPMPDDNLIHEDFFTWLSILQTGGYALGIDEPLLVYRLHSTSKSANKADAFKMNLAVYRKLQLPPAKRLASMISYTARNLKKYAGIERSK